MVSRFSVCLCPHVCVCVSLSVHWGAIRRVTGRGIHNPARMEYLNTCKAKLIVRLTLHAVCSKGKGLNQRHRSSPHCDDGYQETDDLLLSAWKHLISEFHVIANTWSEAEKMKAAAVLFALLLTHTCSDTKPFKEDQKGTYLLKQMKAHCIALLISIKSTATLSAMSLTFLWLNHAGPLDLLTSFIIQNWQ